MRCATPAGGAHAARACGRASRMRRRRRRDRRRSPCRPSARSSARAIRQRQPTGQRGLAPLSLPRRARTAAWVGTTFAMRRPGHGVRAALAIALIVGAGMVGMVAARARDGGETAAGLRANLVPPDLDGSPAPRIRLRDARGRTVDSARLAGRPYLVTFVYTRCADVCPIIGSEIAGALERLGARAHAVAVLAVSVDPRGDTPARARRWLGDRRLPRQAHYLLGGMRRLTPISRDWFVVPRAGTLTDPRRHDASV